MLVCFPSRRTGCRYLYFVDTNTSTVVASFVAAGEYLVKVFYEKGPSQKAGWLGSGRLAVALSVENACRLLGNTCRLLGVPTTTVR